MQLSSSSLEKTILESLTNVCRQKLNSAKFGHFNSVLSGETNFGDYSTSIALQLFPGLSDEEKALFKSPYKLSQEITEILLQDDILKQFCEKITVAAPGFINFCLKDQVKIDIFQNLFLCKEKKIEEIAEDIIIVEFSSPNIAKPFTIGHLRSTIIGAAIANLLEKTGHKVIRDNHVGDWGTQFGKQVVAIQKWGNLEEIAQNEQPIKELVRLYVKFHEEAEKDPILVDEAREIFKKMEGGDQIYLSIWRKIIDLSMKEFNRIYGKLGIHFDENDGQGYGESFVRNETQAIANELREKGLLRISQEAQIIEFKPETKLPPLMILKKDGSSLYATRDLALDKFRLEKYGSNLKIINEVGKEQSLYFRQLYKTEELLGWFKPEQRIHVGHGLYRFKDRKMSTRKGDVVWLDDILLAAETKVKEMKENKLSTQDVQKIALGAIKWNDLVRESANDIDFDLNLMLSLKGNSGPYMQYSVVRVQSIIKKANLGHLNPNELKILIDSDILFDKNDKFLSKELGAEELRLLSKLINYERELQRAVDNLAPHLLANYLFDLAQEFNNYYAKREILGNQSRLVLIKAVGQVLTVGLDILGIQIPTQM